MPSAVGQSGRDLVVVNLQRTAADGVAKLRIGAKIDEVMVPLMQMLGLEVPTFKLERNVSVSRSNGEIRVRGVDSDDTPNDLLWNVQFGYGCNPPQARCEIEFNQDAHTTGQRDKRGLPRNLPRPGDRGVLLEWPWDAHDSRAQVTTDSGASWVVTPDILNVSDGPVETGSTETAVYNAGSMHGHLLEHVGPDAMTSECSSIRLMFRAHYREPPLQLSTPADHSETLYRIVYSPLEGSWAQPEILSHSGPAPITHPQAQLKALEMIPEEVCQMKLLREMAQTPEQQQAVREVAATALQSMVRRKLARNHAQHLSMRVVYREQPSDTGEYRCYHQIQLEGDLLEKVASVHYNVPGQGFKQDVHHKAQSPFQMKFGPCWGRPHVTVDVVLKDGTKFEQVWSENLPAANQTIPLRVETA